MQRDLTYRSYTFTVPRLLSLTVSFQNGLKRVKMHEIVYAMFPKNFWLLGLRPRPPYDAPHEISRYRNPPFPGSFQSAA